MEIERVIDWSELCPEILSEIGDRLGTRPNVYNFREVCRNWRYALSYIPPTLPYFSPLFPHTSDSDLLLFLTRGAIHLLVADGVYLLRPRKNPESSKPLLITVEELFRGKLSVRLPLTRIIATEHLYKNETFLKTLDLSDFHVYVIARGYTLRATFAANAGLSQRNKLVLFANPAAFEPLSISDYTALVWFDHGPVMWVRLSQPSDWGFLGYKGTSKFDDIVNFNGRVYGVDRIGKVYAVNYDLRWAKGENFRQTLGMECIVSDSISSGCDSDRRKRLVVDSSGVLYLVERVIYCGCIHFKVYKLNEESSKLDEVSGIGDDQILFVCFDWCFFALAADFPGVKGNCIIFSKNSFAMYSESTSVEYFCFGRDGKDFEVCVFHFEDGNVGPITAFHGYSDIFWPPAARFCPKVGKSNPL